ncbi:MAG TPA: DUF1684 domain-containing protein [Actinomycetota bacterium]|jgi:hypothetical protein
MMSTHEDEILRWRENRVARLRGPDGWLAVVGLAWLQKGENSVGSAPESRVLLPRGPGLLGGITVEGDAVVATFEADAGVTHDGAPVTTLNLQDDLKGDPTLLRLGSLTFHVIRRGDRLAVRVKDAESPSRRSFTGIDYFSIDPRWRLQARFEPYDPPRTAHVPTVVGLEESYLVPGALAFEHDAVTYRIEAFLEGGETDLFIIFGDLTNRSETYGGGRYMYTRPPDDRGIVVLDFNKAYNPPCVFTPFATCALPAPQNRLPIRVEAGEKLYRGPAVPPVVPRG